MELVFNGNKVVASVEGQRVANIYCVDYATGRYDVMFNDDVIEQDPIVVIGQLLVNANERTPIVESNEINTWRVVVPNPILGFEGIIVRNDNDKIVFSDNMHELFQMTLVEDGVYVYTESKPTELRFNPQFEDAMVEKFKELFSDRQARFMENSIYLYFQGNVDDHPLDMFNVVTASPGNFTINSSAGNVGMMFEVSMPSDGTTRVGVEFHTYSGNALPEQFCRDIYHRATGYTLGKLITEKPQRYEVQIHDLARIGDVNSIVSSLSMLEQEDNAWIAIKQILPSVLIDSSDKSYIVMPAYVDARDCTSPCVGNVVYLGKNIGRGIVLQNGYLCIPATDELRVLFNPIGIRGGSAIPVTDVLTALSEASDMRPELYVSMLEYEQDIMNRSRMRAYNGRGDGRRDRGYIRSHSRGR